MLLERDIYMSLRCANVPDWTGPGLISAADRTGRPFDVADQRFAIWSGEGAPRWLLCLFWREWNCVARPTIARGFSRFPNSDRATSRAIYRPIPSALHTRFVLSCGRTSLISALIDNATALASIVRESAQGNISWIVFLFFH